MPFEFYQAVWSIVGLGVAVIVLIVALLVFSFWI